MVDWGKGCIQILFTEQDIKAENCEKHSFKQTQPSVKSVSTNKYLIYFYRLPDNIHTHSNFGNLMACCKQVHELILVL